MLIWPQIGASLPLGQIAQIIDHPPRFHRSDTELDPCASGDAKDFLKFLLAGKQGEFTRPLRLVGAIRRGILGQ